MWCLKAQGWGKSGSVLVTALTGTDETQHWIKTSRWQGHDLGRPPGRAGLSKQAREEKRRTSQRNDTEEADKLDKWALVNHCPGSGSPPPTPGNKGLWTRVIVNVLPSSQGADNVCIFTVVTWVSTLSKLTELSTENCSLFIKCNLHFIEDDLKKVLFLRNNPF